MHFRVYLIDHHSIGTLTSEAGYLNLPPAVALLVMSPLSPIWSLSDGSVIGEP
jgi:hypothetical protein